MKQSFFRCRPVIFSLRLVSVWRMESGPTSLDSKRKLNMSLGRSEPTHAANILVLLSDDILKESKVAKTTVLRPPGHEPKPKLRTNSIDAAGEFMERSDQSFPTNRSRGSRVTPYPSMRQSGSTLPKNCSSVYATFSVLLFPSD